MLRSLFSTASIFVLLVPTFFSPASTAAARRCDVEPPQTLLSLHRNSDSIHIGQLDRIEEGTITEDTEDYTVIDIKKHFSVSSTIKGESRKFFTLDEKDYRYKNQENAEEEEHGEAMDEGDSASLKTGDSVILFLKKGEGEDAKAETAHWRDGIKKLDRDEMSSYEKRLRELNGIFGGKKVDDGAIVRWLVEASLDPNTRWEGAYELYQSFQQAGWKKERAEQLAEMRKKGEKVDENEETDAEPDTSVYSTLLTDGQKSGLLNILLESGPIGDRKITDRQKRGDDILIELVSRWGDSRFAAFLVDRLRSSEDDNWERSTLMSKIAETLKDDELSGISSKYGEAVYQEDDAVVGEDPDAATPTDETAEASTENGVEPADDAVETPTPAKVTYKQLRSDLFEKFIARSEAVLAKADGEETAKLVTNPNQ